MKYAPKAKSKADQTFRKAFAREYVKSGFVAKHAYKKLRPNVTEHTAEVNSSKLVATEDVQNEITGVLDRLTPDYVLSNIEAIAKEGKRDDTRLAAWIAIGRYLSLWKDSPSSQTAVVNAIDLASIRKAIREEKAVVHSLSTQAPAHTQQDIATNSTTDTKPQHNEYYKTKSEDGTGATAQTPQPPPI